MYHNNFQISTTVTDKSMLKMFNQQYPGQNYNVRQMRENVFTKFGQKYTITFTFT